MKRHWKILLGPLAIVALAACRFPHLGSSSEPVGQVVASVNGQDVTLRDLGAEMSGVSISDPKVRKAAEQRALRAIVSRRILASVAQAQGLDKTPDFAVAKQRALDELLVQALATKVASSVPPPTHEEAQSFVTDHPEIFAERKIFSVDQIQCGRLPDAVLAQLKPLNSLDAIAALLSQNNIQYRRGTADLDSLSLDPRVVDSIVKLPPNDVFVIPLANEAIVNQIKQTRVVPVTGEPAVNLALQLLRRQHTQEAVARELNSDLTKGAATVRYNRAYAPAPTAPRGQAATNATSK